jgi:hypothetical protein
MPEQTVKRQKLKDEEPQAQMEVISPAGCETKKKIVEVVVPHFSMHEEDYRIVSKLAEMFAHEMNTGVSAEERRVYELRMRGIKHFRGGLPSFIGELKYLEYLALSKSNITSLPPSIGKLHNLKFLSLWYTEISELPEEIGDLTSLHELILTGNTKLEVLPSSIGKLRSLKQLYIGQTLIEALPEEIGNLSKLEILYATGSHLSSLPACFGRLAGCLMMLRLEGTSIPEIQKENDLNDFLWKLVREFPLLGHLGKQFEKGRKNLKFALACNRARSRINFGFNGKTRTWENFIFNNKKRIPIVPKLLPLILRHPQYAFQRYPFESYYDPLMFRTIEQADAIYHLLTIGRELLIGHLLGGGVVLDSCCSQQQEQN